MLGVPRGGREGRAGPVARLALEVGWVALLAGTEANGRARGDGDVRGRGRLRCTIMLSRACIYPVLICTFFRGVDHSLQPRFRRTRSIRKSGPTATVRNPDEWIHSRSGVSLFTTNSSCGYRRYTANGRSERDVPSDFLSSLFSSTAHTSLPMVRHLRICRLRLVRRLAYKGWEPGHSIPPF